MNAALVSPVRAHRPVRMECMLHSGARVQRIRRLVSGIDQSARAAAGRSWQAAGIGGLDARRRSLVNGLKRRHPAVLRQVVVVEAEAGTDDRAPVLPQRISNSQTRRNGLAVIVRGSPMLEQGHLQSLHGEQAGVVQLGSSGGREEPESGVVPQAEVQGKMRGRAPGILRVQAEPLYILRESTIDVDRCENVCTAAGSVRSSAGT